VTQAVALLLTVSDRPHKREGLFEDRQRLAILAALVVDGAEPDQPLRLTAPVAYLVCNREALLQITSRGRVIAQIPIGDPQASGPYPFLAKVPCPLCQPPRLTVQLNGALHIAAPMVDASYSTEEADLCSPFTRSTGERKPFLIEFLRPLVPPKLAVLVAEIAQAAALLTTIPTRTSKG
jgi:hypothetical protein